MRRAVPLGGLTPIFLFRNGPTEQGSIEQYTGFYGTIDFIASTETVLETLASVMLLELACHIHMMPRYGRCAR